MHPEAPRGRAPVFRWVEHTSEIELEIEADTEEAVFAEALAALSELLGREPPQGAVVHRELDLASPDRAALLADWLAELAYLAESDGFVPEQIERFELSADGLIATVVGRLGAPPHLVKAVTYHQLEFAGAGNEWHARVVLDV